MNETKITNLYKFITVKKIANNVMGNTRNGEVFAQCLILKTKMPLFVHSVI